MNTSNRQATLPSYSDRLDWWIHARLGMFIHWGLYALPARHEWVMKYEKIPAEAYRKYFDLFDPDLFDPAVWARLAKQAGMKYAVLTAKHHDGFCLWDTACTDFKAPNTPCGKDLLAEWLDAFRAAGLRVGVYYSLLDWVHPHYPVDRNHPLRPESDDGYATLNENRDIRIYQQYIKDQVRELLTGYGQIDIIWLDYSFPSGKYGKGHADWDSRNLLDMVRDLQPHIIVNDRLDLVGSGDGGDFTTPEQYRVAKRPERDGKPLPWETCQTFSGSWGYHRDEMTWKDPRQLLVLLIDTVSKAGNLLLNVGPTGRGTIDPRAVARLDAISRWMHLHARSIYSCTSAPAEFAVPDQCLLTWNPALRRLYIHLLDYPMGNLRLKSYAGKIRHAQFLHDASEILPGKPMANVTWQEELDQDECMLILPIQRPDVEIPVIELFV